MILDCLALMASRIYGSGHTGLYILEYLSLLPEVLTFQTRKILNNPTLHLKKLKEEKMKPKVS